MATKAVSSGSNLYQTLQDEARKLNSSPTETTEISALFRLANILKQNPSVCYQLYKNPCDTFQCTQVDCRYPHSEPLRKLLVYTQIFLSKVKANSNYKAAVCEKPNCMFNQHTPHLQEKITRCDGFHPGNEPWLHYGSSPLRPPKRVPPEEKEKRICSLWETFGICHKGTQCTSAHPSP